MANFVLLYVGGSMPEDEAGQAAAMQAWGAWYGGLGDSVVDPGKPFSPAAKSIASDGTVSDSAIGTPASGYTIIKADSLDAAVGAAKGCPLLQAGGRISVYETFDMM